MAVPTTEFTSKTTAIPGLLVFDVTHVGDDRGWFQEKYQKAKLVAAGLPEDFTVVQNSVAFNKVKGVTRGLHAEPWDKYISVVTGQIFVAYVDLRPGPGFGHTVTLEVDKNKAVFLPNGVANSYQALSDDVYYLYSVNAHWSEAAYATRNFVNLNDADLNIAWPIPLDQAIISDRDRHHLSLKELRKKIK